jgi:hypothetical protein
MLGQGLEIAAPADGSGPLREISEQVLGVAPLTVLTDVRKRRNKIAVRTKRKYALMAGIEQSARIMERCDGAIAARHPELRLDHQSF